MTQFGWHSDSQGEIKYLMIGVKERCTKDAPFTAARASSQDP